MKTYHKFTRQKGFSLVELMIALAIFGLVVGAILLMSQTSEVSYKAGQENIEMQQNTRAALELMVREIREVGADPGNIIASPFVYAGQDTIEFLSDKEPEDANGDGVISGDETDLGDDSIYGLGDGDVNDPGEHLRYFVSNDTLYREDFATDANGTRLYPTAIPLLTNVHGVEFTYYRYEPDATDPDKMVYSQFTPTQITDLLDIINVKINIGMKSSDDTSDRTFGLSSNASIRQMESWEAADTDTPDSIFVNQAPVADLHLTGPGVVPGQPAKLECDQIYDFTMDAYDDDGSVDSVQFYWVNDDTGVETYLYTSYLGPSIETRPWTYENTETGTVDDSNLFKVYGTGNINPVDLADVFNCCQYSGTLKAVAYDNNGDKAESEMPVIVDCATPYMPGTLPPDAMAFDNIPGTTYFHDTFDNEDNWDDDTRNSGEGVDGEYKIVSDCDIDTYAGPDGGSGGTGSSDCSTWWDEASGQCIPPTGGGTYYHDDHGQGGSGATNVTLNTQMPENKVEYTALMKFKNRLPTGNGQAPSPHTGMYVWYQDEENYVKVVQQGNSGVVLEGMVDGHPYQTSPAQNDGMFTNEDQDIYMIVETYDPDREVNFEISDGTIISDQDMYAKITLIGGSMTSGSWSMPVTAKCHVGDEVKQPWGPFHLPISGAVDDDHGRFFERRYSWGKDSEEDEPDLIPGGTPVYTTGRSWYRNSGTDGNSPYDDDYHEFETHPSYPLTDWTWVLRDGDLIPDTPGANTQPPISDFLASFVNDAGTHMSLGLNQAIYLHELYCTNCGGAADYQDLVILLDLSLPPTEVSSSPQIYAHVWTGDPEPPADRSEWAIGPHSMSGGDVNKYEALLELGTRDTGTRGGGVGIYAQNNACVDEIVTYHDPPSGPGAGEIPGGDFADCYCDDNDPLWNGTIEQELFSYCNSLDTWECVDLEPPPTQPGDWVEVLRMDWEDGWVDDQGINWGDGGGDAGLTSNMSYGGSYSGWIRDNSGGDSGFYMSSGIDVSDYDEVKITFNYYGNGMSNGHDFWLRYYDGYNWLPSNQYVERWVKGTDFNNDEWGAAEVVMSGNIWSLSDDFRISFRCDASNNNNIVYIDDISIWTKGGSGSGGSGGGSGQYQLGDWEDILFMNFENGWVDDQNIEWLDGGDYCRRTTDNNHDGSYCAEMAFEGSQGGFWMNEGLNLLPEQYEDIKIEFWYYAEGCEADVSDGFGLRYKDGNGNYDWVKFWRIGTDFPYNDVFYQAEFIMNKDDYDFSGDFRLSFRPDSDYYNDEIYIDEIKISGRRMEEIPDTSPPPDTTSVDTVIVYEPPCPWEIAGDCFTSAESDTCCPKDYTCCLCDSIQCPKYLYTPPGSEASAVVISGTGTYQYHEVYMKISRHAAMEEVGIIFWYQDDENYARVVWDETNGDLIIGGVVNGREKRTAVYPRDGGVSFASYDWIYLGAKTASEGIYAMVWAGDPEPPHPGTWYMKPPMAVGDDSNDYDDLKTLGFGSVGVYSKGEVLIDEFDVMP